MHKELTGPLSTTQTFEQLSTPPFRHEALSMRPAALVFSLQTQENLREGIKRRLREDFEKALAELRKIKETLFAREGGLYRIKRHISHMELHEEIEGSFFKEIEESCSSQVREYIDSCRTGHLKLYYLFHTLIDTLVSGPQPAVSRIFASLGAFEESFLRAKAELIFPGILDELDDAGVRDLEQKLKSCDERQREPVEIY